MQMNCASGASSSSGKIMQHSLTHSLSLSHTGTTIISTRAAQWCTLNICYLIKKLLKRQFPFCQADIKTQATPYNCLSHSLSLPVSPSLLFICFGFASVALVFCGFLFFNVPRTLSYYHIMPSQVSHAQRRQGTYYFSTFTQHR